MQHPEAPSDSDSPAAASTLLCHRCGATLRSGSGEYYLVRIDAIADPTPPTVDDTEISQSMAADYELLIAQMEDMSEQELMDQVHLRLVLHLCNRCYRKWIEKPTG